MLPTGGRGKLWYIYRESHYSSCPQGSVQQLVCRKRQFPGAPRRTNGCTKKEISLSIGEADTCYPLWLDALCSRNDVSMLPLHQRSSMCHFTWRLMDFPVSWCNPSPGGIKRRMQIPTFLHWSCVKTFSQTIMAWIYFVSFRIPKAFYSEPIIHSRYIHTLVPLTMPLYK